ncbi:coiled-coil domain-containing protein [Thiomicrospira microaerophila]|uniref:AAA family ATPase n=1 Tax=Thiomicrospira microaerophila TaxID=406020 RepID=UPI0005CA3292|nr:AAA family ATPase [Thiomicrospira microaerophila]
MRLKQIKIVGFKSFVEPTRLVLPSDLVGIVGPNGCGKSNTLDAVRWVMGESSARELRGGDMNDVLFNGSDKRKAVSQCSVELLFDNEAGMAGGAYASYSEISVKRVHHREDGTRYFLNQQACRRRDILDLFNGTGLGPRSYALIGQGNISRIIEAKPEDMRVYLEEVAGIGPYRSRRKETLLRLNRTRENMTQLRVMQDALTEQSNHLALQAEKARDHRQAIERQQALEKNLYYLQWHQLHQQQTRVQSDLRLAEKSFAQTKADWDSAQKAWLLARQKLPTLQADWQAFDTEFHQLDKKLEKLKQQQAFSGQQSQQWLDQQALNQQQHQMHETQLSHINQQMDDIRLDIEAIEEELDSQTEQLEGYESSWSALDLQKRTQEQTLQKQQWRTQQSEQAFKEAQQQLKTLEQSLAHLEAQRAWLMQNVEPSTAEQGNAQLEALIEQRQQLEQQLAPVNQMVALSQATHQKTRDQLAQAQQTQFQLVSDFKAAEAEHQALVKVQQRLLADAQVEWPSDLSARDLVSVLKVEAGWQTAVEGWLGARLQGLLLDKPVDWAELNPLPNASLIGWNPPALDVHPQSLAAKIQQPELVRYLARDIYVLSDQPLVQPLVQLKPFSEVAGQNTIWLIDKQGVLYSEFACLQPLNAPSNAKLSGSLERQQQIVALAEQQTHLSDAITKNNRLVSQLKQQQADEDEEQAALKAEQQQLERQVLRLEDQIAHAQQTHQAWLQKHQSNQQQLTDLGVREQALIAQQNRLEQTIESINAQFELLDEQEEKTSQTLEKLITQLQPIEREREKLLLQTQRLSQQQHQQKQAYQQLQFQQQQVAQQLKQDSLQAELILRHLAQAQPVDDAELEQLNDQLEQVKQARDSLGQRREVLIEHVDDAQQRVDSAQQTHHQAEQYLVTLQLQLQAQQQQIHQLQKTVEGQGFSFYELAQLRFEEQPIEQVEAALKQVKLHLSRLGAVNMTAIEEFEQAKIKLDTLVSQLADLTQSIDTLEQAIAQIDQDSRQRLLITFDQVNQSFKNLFPKLFQGGHAKLTWVDEQQDPLEGGLMVMAQPPGKRTTRIQLLSGGEKTLSALALIFAIFELKPAPFCILDEVDAPLDDSNVIRFCGLVRSLSEKVQFIYITHNKTTMAMAKHLVGVTMHEPGVSRLVSVDLDAAVEMIGD